MPPWVSTKGIAGLRMKGPQRTCALARYTRLIVLPRFLCVWPRNSRAEFELSGDTLAAVDTLRPQAVWLMGLRAAY